MSEKEGIYNMKKECNKKGFFLNMIYSIGCKSVNSKCSWWFNQPKIPLKMKYKKQL